MSVPARQKKRLKMFIQVACAIALAAALPLLLFAAGEIGKQTSFKGLVEVLVGYINSLLGILMAGSVLMFFYGIAKFILNAGSSGASEEGKRLMGWGLVGLFVMVSIFGIIKFFVQGTFGF